MITATQSRSLRIGINARLVTLLLLVIHYKLSLPLPQHTLLIRLQCKATPTPQSHMCYSDK